MSTWLPGSTRRCIHGGPARTDRHAGKPLHNIGRATQRRFREPVARLDKCPNRLGARCTLHPRHNRRFIVDRQGGKALMAPCDPRIGQHHTRPQSARFPVTRFGDAPVVGQVQIRCDHLGVIRVFERVAAARQHPLAAIAQNGAPLLQRFGRSGIVDHPRLDGGQTHGWGVPDEGVGHVAQRGDVRDMRLAVEEDLFLCIAL